MHAIETTVGLRIDVDTLRGTMLGVPGLLHVLKRNRIKATFFFSVGPDNMGRHLWRLVRPSFLRKMVRSRAAALYGWDIVFRGTLWPGPVIGDRCGDVIRRTVDEGHEIGLHAWDHYRWQVKVAAMDRGTILQELEHGKAMLERISGVPISCSAAPGWRCTDAGLMEKERLAFRYNSDCRGHSIFYPKVSGGRLSQKQVPVTLPTYDELIGGNGITVKTYNRHLLSRIHQDRLNVLTLHAEVEGISCLQMFQDFLNRARARNICFRPLKTLLTSNSAMQSSRIIRGKIEGRAGWISCQEGTVDRHNGG